MNRVASGDSNPSNFYTVKYSVSHTGWTRSLLAGGLIVTAFLVNWPAWKIVYSAQPLSDSDERVLRSSALLHEADAKLILSSAIEGGGELFRSVSALVLASPAELRAQAEHILRGELHGESAEPHIGTPPDLVARCRSLDYPQKFTCQRALLSLLVLLGEQKRLAEVWPSNPEQFYEFFELRSLPTIGWVYGLSEDSPRTLGSDSDLERWPADRIKIRTLIREGQPDVAHHENAKILREYQRPLTELLIARIGFGVAIAVGFSFLVFDAKKGSRRPVAQWAEGRWLLPCFLTVWLSLNAMWMVELFGDWSYEDTGRWLPFILSLVLGGVIATYQGARVTHLMRLLTPGDGRSTAYVIGALCLAIVADAAGAFVIFGLATFYGDSQRLFGVLSGHWNLEMYWPSAGAIAVVGYEELCFRGLLFSGLRAKLGLPIAAIVSSVVFAAGHPPAANALGAAWGGLVYAILYHRTGSLWPCVIAHLFYNSMFAVS